MPYRKRTRLRNNIDCWRLRPVCKKDRDNMNADRKRRKETAQRAPPSGTEGNNFRQRDLYKAPETLITEIVASMEDHDK